jgi:very-short-patch-repair endonuclease
VDVVEILERAGGIADRASLVVLTSRAEVDRALGQGAVVRDGHGRYALPVADSARRAANGLDGVVSHRSAALLHGWELKTAPREPDVLVPKNRKVARSRREGIALHRGPSGQCVRRVTSPQRTVVDRMRGLPFDEVLAVADSALRHGSFTQAELVALAADARGPGAARCRRVAALADGRAANPFESVLRAIALDVPGLDLRPQVEITGRGFSVRPDLVDVERRLVLEADSFAWHGDRASLRWDTQRYNNLVVRGWLVLRFAWEDVMHDPAYVRRTLTAVAALVGRRTNSSASGHPAA